MEKETRMRLHPFRIASYLILFLGMLLIFDFFRSYFFLTFLLLMVVYPIISVTGARKIAEMIELKAGADQPVIEQKEVALVQIQIVNPTWFFLMNARLQVSLANAFFENGSVMKVSMPVKPHDVSKLFLPVQLVDLGKFTISCSEVELPDLFGIISLQVPLHFQLEIDAVPAKGKGQEIEITGFLSGMSESEESRAGGSDFAEVSDIREYVPGDRIRDIHWKLSAKQEKLMVKERISMAGSEIMLLLKLSPDKERVEKLFHYTYALVQAFMEQRIPVCLLCWNQNTFEFEQYSCDLLSELGELFSRLYEVPLSQRLQEQQEYYMKNCFPHLGTYLLAQEQGGHVQVVIQENV